MWRKASYRKASAPQSLLQRLAKLEHAAAKLPNKHKRDFGAFFGLGFASSCIGGGIALLILLFLNPGDARGNFLSSVSPAHSAPSPTWSHLAPQGSALTVVPKQLVDRVARVSAVALSRDFVTERRHLWWRLPTVTANAN